MKKLVLLTLIFILVTSCSDADWEFAQNEDTIESYDKYIKGNTKSKYVEYAKRKIDSLQSIIFEADWVQTKRKHSVKEYQNFLNKYPGNVYSDEAAIRLKALEKPCRKNVKQIADFIDSLYGSNINLKINEGRTEKNFAGDKTALFELELFDWSNVKQCYGFRTRYSFLVFDSKIYAREQFNRILALMGYFGDFDETKEEKHFNKFNLFLKCGGAYFLYDNIIICNRGDCSETIYNTTGSLIDVYAYLFSNDSIMDEPVYVNHIGNYKLNIK